MNTQRQTSNGMKYLGIDYGTKRIGVAVSSERIAFPRGTLPNDSDFFSALSDLVEKEKIERIVVGDTRSFGGHENPVTREAAAFIERLKKKTALPVLSAWEAGSSIEASRLDPSAPKDDGSAAAVILQRYLDMQQ